MQRVSKDEWKHVMTEAVKNKYFGMVAFLWTKFDEIDEKGYFEVPFFEGKSIDNRK